jgi:hypothetical protein
MPTFEPPTVKQGVPGDVLFSRFGSRVGQSVVKKGGVFVLDPFPWLGDLTGLVDGRDYFLGGHLYVIDASTAAALTAAGFTVTPDAGYGQLGYGIGPLGIRGYGG